MRSRRKAHQDSDTPDTRLARCNREVLRCPLFFRFEIALAAQRMYQVVRGMHAIKGRSNRFGISQIPLYDLRARSNAVAQHFRPSRQTTHPFALILQHTDQTATDVARCAGDQNESGGFCSMVAICGDITIIGIG